MANMKTIQFELDPGGNDVSIDLLKGQLQAAAFGFELKNGSGVSVEQLADDDGHTSSIQRILVGRPGKELEDHSLEVIGMLGTLGSADGQNYSVTLDVKQGTHAEQAILAGTLDQAIEAIFVVKFV